MNGLEPLFSSWTGRRKGIPKGVDETHHWPLKWQIFKQTKNCVKSQCVQSDVM